MSRYEGKKKIRGNKKYVFESNTSPLFANGSRTLSRSFSILSTYIYIYPSSFHVSSPRVVSNRRLER